VVVSGGASNSAHGVSARPSWQALKRALAGNALGAFPEEAFEEEVVVHPLFGRRPFILSRPDAIRHVLVDDRRQRNRSRRPESRERSRAPFGHVTTRRFVPSACIAFWVRQQRIYSKSLATAG